MSYNKLQSSTTWSQHSELNFSEEVDWEPDIQRNEGNQTSSEPKLTNIRNLPSTSTSDEEKTIKVTKTTTDWTSIIHQYHQISRNTPKKSTPRSQPEEKIMKLLQPENAKDINEEI